MYYNPFTEAKVVINQEQIDKLLRKFRISEADLVKYHLKPLEEWFLKEKKKMNRHYGDEDRSHSFSQEHINMAYNDLLETYYSLLGLCNDQPPPCQCSCTEYQMNNCQG